MSERKHASIFGAGARGRAALAVGGLAVMASALLASTAAANGRFPRAQRLIQDQANPDVMALYGTYGLIVTRDGGASWRHVCEAATGPYAGEDSLLEIMQDERIVLRTDTGLSRSDASYCGYDAVFGGDGQALQDITRDSASPNGILALSTALGDDGVFASSLSASSDGGATFTPLANVPTNLLELGLTLDVAASQPGRIYISGFDAQSQAVLLESTNRGQSFTAKGIAGLDISAPPYIAAVSALDPDRLFVRTDVFSRADNDFEARETANDSLYFSPDAGATWHLALNKRGKLYGFALSPDERFVLAGFGDPVLPAIFVEPDELGLYRVALADLVASPDDPPWERIYDRGVTCLRWTESALFACLAQDESGFEMGRAPDASFSLANTAPFESLLRLPEVRPIECPAESPAAACLVEEVTGWLATCGVLRAQCSLDAAGGAGGAGGAGPSAPGAGGATGDMSSAGGMSSAPSAGGSSAAGSSSTGVANGGVSGSSSGDGASPPSASGSSKSSGSCATAAPGRETSPGVAAASWIAALVLVAARRRRPGRGVNALLVALLPLGASSLSGCGDEATPDDPGAGAGDGPPPDAVPAMPADCGGAGDDFVLGMSKTTSDGALTVAVVAADPAPPLKGANAWTVQLSDESGTAITAANVSFAGWMPLHGHGLNAVPLIRELEGGRYEIDPIVLYMPQLWELSVVVARDDETEDVTFDVCVP
ncbi:MAG TPA: FixH family protein [Polyangiaceae bacterium]|nr:FixH family protein [Polyangiaceae bacterium]